MLVTAALASVVFSVTIQQQNVAAFNEENNQFVLNMHNHLKCGGGDCDSNSVEVTNDETGHSNVNCNDNSNSPQRGQDPGFGESCNVHSH